MESANRRNGPPPAPRHPELGERHQEVLASIIVNFVLTGEPVASRTVARASTDGVSSATVRNAMADLEEMGFISQPHTSAGRVPTDLGYRFYVDRMMARRPLGAEERRALAQALPVAGESPDIQVILGRAARLLAALSHHVGLVLAPRFSYAIMKRMDFVHLHGRKVLALFVSHSGMVDHRLIEAAEPVTQEDLNRINAFVRERFSGLTLPEIRIQVLAMMSEEKALYDRLLARALDLSHAYLERRESEEGQVLVEGAGAPAGAPGPADIEQMTTLFRAFESKGRLVGLLNACLEQGETCIYIGSECAEPSFKNLSLITAPYSYRDHTVGAVGIIGPTRMDYDRQVTLVGSFSQFLTESLARRAGAQDPAPGGTESSEEESGGER